jgi:hypothetical protein
LTNEQLKLISRIIKTQDGKDLVEEVLKPLLLQNHMDILKEGKQFRDESVGFGNCLLFLIELFNDCDVKLETRANVNVPDLTA